MLKVLFVAENLSYGGAQKMLTFVANNLDRSKYQVAVLNENSGAKVARPLNGDIEYYEHPKFTKRGIRRFKELGGSFVSVGSDAHYTEHLALGIDVAYDAALKAGFDSITFFQKRTPIQMKIELEG